MAGMQQNSSNAEKFCMVSWILIFVFEVKVSTGFTTVCGVSKHEWLMNEL